MIQDLSNTPPVSLSRFHRLLRSAILKRCNRLTGGLLSVRDFTGLSCELGDPDSDLRVSMEIHHPRFYRRVLSDGDLGVAQSLIDGDWSCDDLTGLVQIFIRNLHITDQLAPSAARVMRLFHRFGHWMRRNTLGRSRKNIQAHYDLGNEFYSLWLDPTMNYSSGIFVRPESTMEEASNEKMDRLCRKLNLKPSDHLLEIGSGWGALACYAAKNYGCRVTTTTISDQQYEAATKRIAQQQLGDRVTILNQDYRQLEGQYDKIVSVEMIEAVGHQYYDSFFNKCMRLLKPDGEFMMQAIVIADHRYDEHIRNVDFISQYIFPGGSLPSISRLTTAASHSGDMRLLELADITDHYAETLRRWRSQFLKQLPSIRAMGFDSRFIRMWHYYLCYCEAGFEERQINTVQLLFAKSGCKRNPLNQTDVSATQHNGSTALRPRSKQGAVPC